MRYLVLAAALLAACGGSEGGGPDGQDGDGGKQQERCFDYMPDPTNLPGVIETHCLEEGWEHKAFAWRTGHRDHCAHQPVGYVLVERVFDSDPPVGTQIWGCVEEADCIRSAIDNPECCDGVEYGSRPVADCAD